MRRRDGVFECYATTTCVTRRVTRGTWPRHGATRAIALRMPHTVHLLCLCVRKPVTAARSHRIAARLDVPRRAWKDLSRDASPHARHGPLPHPVPPRRRSSTAPRPRRWWAKAGPCGLATTHDRVVADASATKTAACLEWPWDTPGSIERADRVVDPSERVLHWWGQATREERTMARTISIGAQGFEDIRANGDFYVDKTSFVRE